MKLKPILFNTDMVKALLDGRKTVTRRCVKPQPQFRDGETGTPVHMEDGSWEFQLDQYRNISDYPIKPHYETGDILYVRETWTEMPYGYVYRADDERPEGWDHEDRWFPSIHMPKEAARIFLRVTDVRVERLQDITEREAAKEGVDNEEPSLDSENICDHCPLEESLRGVHCYGGSPVMCEGRWCPDAFEAWEEEFIEEFANLWDSTIKPADLPLYGWDANPWVWVIEFERSEKPDET